MDGIARAIASFLADGLHAVGASPVEQAVRSDETLWGYGIIGAVVFAVAFRLSLASSK